jgi:hypothetical protein
MDFYLDDPFRPVWDGMVIHTEVGGPAGRAPVCP